MWKNNYRDVLRAIHSNNLLLTIELLEDGCPSHIDVDEFMDLQTSKLTIYNCHYMALQTLELAIDNCNFEIVKLLLQHGASAGSPSTTTTFLQRAALSGNRQIIEELLKYNFDWKVLDDETGDSLMHSVLKRKDDHWGEKLTLDNVESWLHFKSIAEKNIIELLKIFLGLGVDVNMTNSSDETCLNLAVKKRMTTVSGFLIDRGAQVDKFIQLNDSLVHSLIKDEINLHGKCESQTVDKKLLRLENVIFLEWWLSKVGRVENYLDRFLFQKAMSYDLRHLVPSLVKYLKNINDTDGYGQPFYYILFKPLKLHWYKIKDFYVYFEYIKDLIDRGIDVNAVDKRGNTLLHAIAGCYESRKTSNLLAQRTMFHYWETDQVKTQSYDGSFDIENLLRFIKRKPSNTPTGREIANLLLSRGCKVDATNCYGKTALYMAVEQNIHWLVEHLIKNGANVNHWNLKSRISLLELAATILNSEQIMETLIRGGAEIRVMDKSHRSISHVAILYSNIDGLKVLLRMGADVNGLNRLGYKPLHTAFELHNSEATLCLLEFGAKMENLLDSTGRDTSPEIHSILTQYAAMQSAADLPISDEKYRFCEMQDTYEPYRSECFREIEIMKKTFIEDNEDTLYDFFHMDPDRKIYFAARKDFKEFKNQFPNCSTLISAHYWMAFERKIMIKHVLGWFKTLTFVLPDLCVERIIKGFENWQMKLIVEDAYKD